MYLVGTQIYFIYMMCIYDMNTHRHAPSESYRVVYVYVYVYVYVCVYTYIYEHQHRCIAWRTRMMGSISKAYVYIYI